MEQERQTPGIRLMPPLVYAVSLFIGMGIEQLLPLVSIPGTWRAGPAVVLIALAGLLIAPTVMRFRKADTPFFDIRKPATRETTDGASSPELIFVQNWLDELQRLVPTDR